MSIFWRRRTRHLKGRFDALARDFDALRRDLRGMAGDLSGAAADAVTSADRVASGALESAEGWTIDNVDSLKGAVRRQPLASLAVAAGAGALVGALLLRR